MPQPGAPAFRAFCEGWGSSFITETRGKEVCGLFVPWGLKRYQQTRQLHFITFSCYHRAPLLTPDARDMFVARVGASTPVVRVLGRRLCRDAGTRASPHE